LATKGHYNSGVAKSYEYVNRYIISSTLTLDKFYRILMWNKMLRRYEKLLE